MTKNLLQKHQDLGLIPCKKVGHGGGTASNPSAARWREVEPWGSVANQPSLTSELPDGERSHLRKHGRWCLLRNDTQGYLWLPHIPVHI